MMKRTATHLLLGALTLVLPTLVSACGGGGSSSGSSASAPVNLGLAVGDAPVDTLSSASMTVTTVQLERPDGTRTGNLLDAPRRFDLLGLALRPALLSLLNAPEGSYVAAHVAVDPSDVELRDLNGDLVPVTVVSSAARSAFADFGPALLRVSDDGFEAVDLDIHLASSLADDPLQAGAMLLDLTLRASQSDGALELDEFRGRVVSVDPSASSFVARVIDDSSPNADFGRFEVVVADGDLMFDDDGLPFGSAQAFLAAISTGTVVEVKGTLLASGRFDASVAEIEDGASTLVEIEGKILSISAASQTFTLLLLEIEKGAAVADPVLASLGDPQVLTISWDANTRVVDKQNGAALGTASFVEGMKADVRFSAFAAPMPFLAASVELEGEGVEHEGTISATGGLPLSFTLTLDASDPAVVSGRVTAPVEVDLSAATRLYVDCGYEPELAAASLLTGQRVKVHGTLSGAPSSANLSAERVRVRPGRLDGFVTAVDLGNGEFTVDVDRVRDPFGGPALGATIQVVLPAAAMLQGDAGALSLADVASLLAGLGAGEVLEVEVEGLADGSGAAYGFECEFEVDD